MTNTIIERDPRVYRKNNDHLYSYPVTDITFDNLAMSISYPCVHITQQTVALAHACGVSVEGELGCLGSLETGMAGEEDGIRDSPE